MTSSVLGQQPHTFEALCAVIETMVRSLKFSFKVVRVPALVTPQGVLFPSFYSFAIATDATAVNTPPVGFTWSHTCTGSNLVLFVMGFGPSALTSVTYNLVNATETRTALTNGDGSGVHWYLAGPTTGANNVIISGTASGAYVSVSYTGASQTGIPDASNTASTTANTLSVSVTTVADNCWVIGCAGDSNGAGTTSAGAAPTTLRVANNNSSKAFDNGAAKTPAGSVTLQLNDTSGAANLYWIAASFAPTAGGGGGRIPSAFQLLGVGS